MVTKPEVLITAGPTWVAIDQARVISNLATGKTGLILAESFKKRGIKVTLLLGPGSCPEPKPGIIVKRFRYYSELERLLDQELKKNKYRAVVHSAAVADYRPCKIISGKISSGRKSWKLSLVGTKKLIHGLKKYRPDILTVGFKFEPSAKKSELIESARALLKKESLGLVVANSNRLGGYQAYILDHRKIRGPFFTKAKMASCLAKLTTGLM